MTHLSTAWNRPGVLALSVVTILLLGSGAVSDSEHAPARPQGDGLVDGVSASGVAASGDSAHVENLRAFARLYGLVRYFHPSDAASDVDWERFAIYGARQVRDASSRAELRAALERLFRPIAPTVQLYRTGDDPPPKPGLLTPPDTADVNLVAWQHRGLDLPNRAPYQSRRLHRRASASPSDSSSASSSPKQPDGQFFQQLDVAPIQGQDVRVRMQVKTKRPGDRAQIWLTLLPADKGPDMVEASGGPVVTDTSWTTVELTRSVPASTRRVFVGGWLWSGTVYFDDVEVLTRASDGAAWTPVEASSVGFDNAGFESGPADSLTGWRTRPPSTDRIALVTETAGEGSRSIRLRGSNVRPLFSEHPSPGETYTAALGRGLSAQVPLALYSRNGRTLRPADAPLPNRLKAALQEVSLPDLSGADASLRYGAVIIHWNVLQHFYPYFDVVETDWDAALTGALRRAAADASSEDFLATLRWMIAQSKDGHGSVRHPLLQKKGTPPISVAQTDSAIAVSALADSLDGEAVQSGNLCAEPGDAVVAVDGTPVEAYVDSLKSYISGSPQWKTYRALADFGIGDAGTPVRLVLRRDGAQKTCTLQRRSDLHVRPDRPSPVTELQPGIFYVDATRAGKDVIDRHIDTLAAAEGVIFDFRGYPERNHDLLTHLSPDTLRSARWLVPQVIYPDRKKPVGYDRPGRWRLPPQQPQISGDVAVLTSARAISYSESVLGIVEHYELGTIVGQPTAGANGNANPYTLPGDYRVNWTGMRVLKHDGSQHHLVGVRPDVPVTPTRSDLRAGRDASLQRALEIIAE